MRRALIAVVATVGWAVSAVAVTAPVHAIPPAAPVAAGVDLAVSCYQAALATGCDFWQVAVHPTALGVLSHRFIIRRGNDTVYYTDQAAQFGAMGTGSRSDTPHYDYRITSSRCIFRSLPP